MAVWSLLTGVKNDAYTPAKLRSEKLGFVQKWNGGELRKTMTRSEALCTEEKGARKAARN